MTEISCERRIEKPDNWEKITLVPLILFALFLEVNPNILDPSQIKSLLEIEHKMNILKPNI